MDFQIVVVISRIDFGNKFLVVACYTFICCCQEIVRSKIEKNEAENIH
jgi:hypothetical protein